MLTIAQHTWEYSFILCECCFDIILEDDTFTFNNKCYCHRCIEEVRP